MARHPFEADGTLRNLDGKWMIELNGSPNGIPDGTPLRILYWTDQPNGEFTEIEQIANMQQLEISIVAHGLAAEGLLGDTKDEFLRRLDEMKHSL